MPVRLLLLEHVADRRHIFQRLSLFHVASYLLQKQGYDVVGLFMRNRHDSTGLKSGGCSYEDDVLFAEMVAKKLDIPFHEVDLSEEYRDRVVDYLFREYAAGRTPNPDVLCNREIKFDACVLEA